MGTDIWRREDKGLVATGRVGTVVRHVRGALVTLTRLFWLMLLFTPTLITAPIALQYGYHRAAWLRLLRCRSNLNHWISC